jgi:hypothetical protein
MMKRKKKKKAKQTTMDIFLKEVTLPQEKPQVGPSGDVPEEGIVITEDDSYVHVIAPQGLPLGQDEDVEDSDTD